MHAYLCKQILIPCTPFACTTQKMRANSISGGKRVGERSKPTLTLQSRVEGKLSVCPQGEDGKKSKTEKEGKRLTCPDFSLPG